MLAGKHRPRPTEPDGNFVSNQWGIEFRTQLPYVPEEAGWMHQYSRSPLNNGLHDNSRDPRAILTKHAPDFVKTELHP